MAEPLLIFTERITPRLRYTARLVFKTLLGLDLRLTTNHNEFMAHTGMRLVYGQQPVGGVPFIRSAGLLERTDISETEPGYGYVAEEVVLFPVQNHPELPFDVLSAAFYMAARYEEYLPFISDVHGRFPAMNSLASRLGFLDRPIVQVWAEILAGYLKRYYPELETSKPTYRFISTVDIDNSFAYRGKGWFRVLGGFSKDLLSGQFERAKERFLVLTRRRQDPYDTFPMQYQLQEEIGYESIYFLLFAQFGRFDRNLPMHSRLLRKSIKYIADFTQVGIHPSYESNASLRKVSREVKGLSEVLNREITQSRQHFLKLRLPETYRRLLQLGITDDYSMGYPNQPGFRAGLSTPYPFYDLENETETSLQIHPLIFLETTFTDHLQLTPEQAWPIMKELIDRVKKHGGECITIWHNRTFSELEPGWKGWNALFKTMASYAVTP